MSTKQMNRASYESLVFMVGRFPSRHGLAVVYVSFQLIVGVFFFFPKRKLVTCSCSWDKLSVILFFFFFGCVGSSLLQLGFL